METGERPYQDVDLLVTLRNELMHYKPEMVGGEEQHKWEKKLRSKFKPNPLLEGSGNAYFPDHCLGSPCATWTIQSVKAFADQYFATLQITPNYAQHHSWPNPDQVAAQKRAIAATT